MPRLSDLDSARHDFQPRRCRQDIPGLQVRGADRQGRRGQSGFWSTPKSASGAVAPGPGDRPVLAGTVGLGVYSWRREHWPAPRPPSDQDRWLTRSAKAAGRAWSSLRLRHKADWKRYSPMKSVGVRVTDALRSLRGVAMMSSQTAPAAGLPRAALVAAGRTYGRVIGDWRLSPVPSARWAHEKRN